MKRPISCSVTSGPGSLISLWTPEVGSIIAVEVRDSSMIRTKSQRIASSVSCSMMRVPVRPPARPVAMTGSPSAFSARATLTPFPPGIVRCSVERCLRPTWKLGTASVLSIAALRVTVMIIAGVFGRRLRRPPSSRPMEPRSAPACHWCLAEVLVEPCRAPPAPACRLCLGAALGAALADHEGDHRGARQQPRRPQPGCDFAGQARSRNRFGGDERHAGHLPATVEDGHGADRRPGVERAVELPGASTTVRARSPRRTVSVRRRAGVRSAWRSP